MRPLRPGKPEVYDSLVDYLVRPLVAHPEDVRVHTVEGNASVLVELRVNPDDVKRVRGSDGATFRAMQRVLAASRRKDAPKPVLDLVEHDAAGDEE